MKLEIKYKETGLDWCPLIPEHWDMKRLKYLIQGKLEYGANEAAELSEIDQPRYIRITDFNENGSLRWETFKSLPFDKAEPYLLKQGDILFARSGATVGKTFIFWNYDGLACYAGYLIKATPNKDINPRFLYLFTKSGAYESWKNSIFIQATIQNIGADKYSELKIPLPSLIKQQKIVDYLDQKTSQIDTIIARKIKLIELLKEERTALINQAVTKGIHSDVEMKPSGIDWLGDIPKHWYVKKLKFIGKSIIGITYSPNDIVEEGKGVLVLRSSNIQDGRLSFNDNVYVNQEIQEKHITKEGDILICARNGSAHLVGKSALIPKENEGHTFGAFMLIFRSSFGRFMYYLFNSNLFKSQTGLYKTSTINQLTSDTINNLYIPFTIDSNERLSIVNFLDKETQRIDTIIYKTEKQIELLKEYKTALINDVVTGQKIV